MKSYVKAGHIIGPQRFFTIEGKFLNITDTKTGDIMLSQLGDKSKLMFGCHRIVNENAARCIIFQNDAFTQGRMKWRNCRLSTKNLDYSIFSNKRKAGNNCRAPKICQKETNVGP